MNIIFFGSSSYCLPVVESLRKNFNLKAIITKPGPIASFAKKHQIACLTPIDKGELSALSGKISKLKPDIAIVADYGLIIPREIFNLPKYKTLNIHFSRLPFLRGASPVQYTILTDQTPWVSVIKMDEGLDAGDIVWQKEYKKITKPPSTNPTFDQLANETAESLYIKLFQDIAYEIAAIVNDYINGKLIPKKQDQSKATFSKALTRDDGFIPFELIIDATKGETKKISDYQDKFITNTLFKLLPNCNIIISVNRAIRAFSPWPGVWTKINLRRFQNKQNCLSLLNESEKKTEKRLKILKSHIDGDRLILDLVQLEGKKPVSWKQFQEGYPNYASI